MRVIALRIVQSYRVDQRLTLMLVSSRSWVFLSCLITQLVFEHAALGFLGRVLRIDIAGRANRAMHPWPSETAPPP